MTKIILKFTWNNKQGRIDKETVKKRLTWRYFAVTDINILQQQYRSVGLAQEFANKSMKWDEKPINRLEYTLKSSI